MEYQGSSGERRAQSLLGSESQAKKFYRRQRLDYLNPIMRDFIARQEMFFLSTADDEGACDGSFRAGPPGFVCVLNEGQIAYPEYLGNGVLGSVGNILQNPKLSLLFMDFFVTTIGLHVNGRGRIVSDLEIADDGAQSGEIHREDSRRGQPPTACWVKVDVEEAYIHCSKHVPLLRKVKKEIHWGTNDPGLKGGDYFEVGGGPGVAHRNDTSSSPPSGHAAAPGWV
ncbi:MAG: pyridoxamine 5-phosphate oxidase [Verrucomicrobiales bacterium]|nr:pyridoxamine 5-phosphate oxidase [Verrucomicrobiales bacterium]